MRLYSHTRFFDKEFHWIPVMMKKDLGLHLPFEISLTFTQYGLFLSLGCWCFKDCYFWCCFTYFHFSLFLNNFFVILRNLLFNFVVNLQWKLSIIWVFSILMKVVSNFLKFLFEILLTPQQIVISYFLLCLNCY